ncbi:hypothetical protein NCC49_001162 [Naganishia albida]|nr:hypothetical protein NCC49_001162 [Naganishia albida]
MTITQSASAPLVVIGGATGNQGGSVLHYLKESDKDYRLRALTRDNSRPKAKAIADLGVDVVSIDLKPENKDKIQEVYNGADAVTNFWEHVHVEREIKEGKAMVDAAVASGVKLFIFSSLPSFIKATNGEIKNVHHFEGKAIIEDYGRSKASDKFQFVAVQAGFYDSNVLHQQLIRKAPDGSWVYKTPISADKPVPSIDIDEYGLWVRAAIEHKEVRDDGRAVPVVAEDISPREMIKAIIEATGANIRIEDNISYEESQKVFPEGTPAHVIEDLGIDMWKALDQCGYFCGVDVKWPLKYLAKKPSTFKEWLARADLSEYKN